MKILSEIQLDKFPAEARVWMLLNKSYSDFYLRIPLSSTDDYNLEIVGFLEKKDAEWAINLLKNSAVYKDLNIFVSSELLTEVRNGARLYEQELCVLDHALAQEFFAVFPDILENYKE